MTTFKISFFDRELDIINVATYRNTNIDHALQAAANNIVTLDLHEAVKAEGNGCNLTQEFNIALKAEIEKLREAIREEESKSTVKYTIYQIDATDERAHGTMFAGLEELKRYGKKFDFSMYEKVYEGEVTLKKDMTTTLEDLFATFNTSRPADYKGRSMSVSDVVIIDGKKYFCDLYGFKKVF
jgi:hypothetical protein